MIMFVILFWILRIVVTLMATSNTAFVLTPLNTNVEIILLFVTLICIALIIKTNMIGALLYLVSYCLYFGVDLYNNVNTILNEGVTTEDGLSLFVSSIAVLIALIVFFDISINKNKSGKRMDKKTDWFFGNKDFDRKMDDRADKNQYKF